ncbi:MAG TPA: tetratricopeptide repeat protein [Polyangiaceae bacterium]
MRLPLRAAVAFLAVTTLSAATASSDAPAAQEKLAEAMQQVAYINLEKARTLYAEAKASAPRGSADWDKALFGEATCAWHQLPIQRANADEAARLFTELLHVSPRGAFAPRSMMNLGRILELPEDRDDPVDLPGARAWYQKVVDLWPNDPIAGEATLRIAGTYIQTFETKAIATGIERLRGWVEARPGDPLASIMWQYLAETYFFPLKDYQRSLEAYDKVDALGWTEKGLQGPTYWRIARLCDRFLNNRQAAIKYYTKIIDETPNSGKAYESALALRRLGAPVPDTAMTRLFTDALSGAVDGAKTPDAHRQDEP